jgi:hypothetical protein
MKSSSFNLQCEIPMLRVSLVGEPIFSNCCFLLTPVMSFKLLSHHQQCEHRNSVPYAVLCAHTCVSVRNPVWPSLQLEARKLALMSLFLDLAQNFCLILQASERCRNQQPSCMRPSLGCSGYFFVNQFLWPPRVWLFVTALVGGVEWVDPACVAYCSFCVWWPQWFDRRPVVARGNISLVYCL